MDEPRVAPTEDHGSRRARFPLGASVTEEDLSGPRAHEVLAALRRTEPVTWSPALGRWLVTSHTLAATALRDAGTFTVDDPRFSTALVVGPSMLSLDGAEHLRHRTPFVGPLRSAGNSDRVVRWAEGAAARLIDGFHHRGRAELRTELAGPLAVSVIIEVLGLSAPRGGSSIEEQVLAWYRDIAAGVLAVDRGRPVPRPAALAVEALRQQVGCALDAGTADGAARMIATISGSGSLSSDELFSNVAVVLFGAIETGEAMIANALYHLLSHPDQLTRVVTDPSLLDRAIDESLRLEPAAAVVDRYATVDTTLGPPGAEIPIAAGEPVTLSLAGANRDPDRFDHPDRFDLDRRNTGAHLSFARGPHACIGSHLARLETRVAISAALNRLSSLALDEAATTAPSGLIFRKPASLVVRWSTPRRATPS